MAGLYELRSELLRDGKISESDVRIIRAHIQRDGRLDQQDVKFLVELLSEADQVCPEFDELFFPALKQVIMDDGRIGEDEQFYLLKMLYANGRIRESEKRFLRELRREATEVTPEFQSLCETALVADETNWDVQGRRVGTSA
jgi:uncharacterized tellurite resistance protein B-like protein